MDFGIFIEVFKCLRVELCSVKIERSFEYKCFWIFLSTYVAGSHQILQILPHCSGSFSFKDAFEVSDCFQLMPPKLIMYSNGFRFYKNVGRPRQ